MISSAVLLGDIKYPGIVNPKAIDITLINIPINVT